MPELLHDHREAAGLTRLAALSAQQAALHAAVLAQVHDSVGLSRRARGADGPERFLVIDLAATLRIGQIAATHLMDEADRLVEVHVGTFAGLADGRVFLAQSRLVLDETRSCSPQVAAEVDARLHAGAPDGLADWAARRLRARVRRLVLIVEAELEPCAVEQRERTAREGRRVSLRPEPDGMGSLWALLPAEQLRQFTVGLDELHRRQVVADRAAGVHRTAEQRRADLLALLPALALHALDGSTPVLRPDGSCPHAAVVLYVHVPLATALGRSDVPALLDGYGPISAGHARRLLPTACLHRVVVDDRTGEPLHTRTPSRHLPPGDLPTGDLPTGDLPTGDLPTGAAPPGPWAERLLRMVGDEPLDAADLLDHDEPRYRPSSRLARFVRLRDPLCTGPGCATHSGRCDLDHEVPWPDGPTAARNLRPRSRRCHRAKSLTWTVRRRRDGGHVWTSPTGRSYTVPPFWDPPPAPRTRAERPGSATGPPGHDPVRPVKGPTAGGIGPRAELPARLAPAGRLAATWSGSVSSGPPAAVSVDPADGDEPAPF